MSWSLSRRLVASAVFGTLSVAQAQSPAPAPAPNPFSTSGPSLTNPAAPLAPNAAGGLPPVPGHPRVPTAPANDTARNPSVAAPFTGYSPLTVAPGEFQITSKDVSAIMTALINREGDVADNDRAYLDQLAAQTATDLNAYTDLLIVGDFKKLSDEVLGGRSAGITLDRFLETLNQVKAARVRIENKLALYQTLSEALPSDRQIDDGKTVHQLPQPRKINFGPITSVVKEKMNAAEAIANNYPFIIVKGLQTDIIPPNSGTALNPKLKIQLLDATQFAARLKEIQKALVPSNEYIGLIRDFYADWKDMIAGFITRYGRMETYRFRDKALSDARARELESIVTGAWMISYSRFVNGTRQGAILPATYNKRYANIDLLTVSLEELQTFREETSPDAISDNDLNDAIESYRNALKVLNQRTVKILDGDASILSRANSAITWIKGERPTAEALLLIVQLLAANVKEEQIIANGRGFDELEAFYNQRWRSTPEDEKVTDQRICAFDHIYNTQNRPTSNCYMGGDTGKGIKADFTRLNDELLQQSILINQSAEARRQLTRAMTISASGETTAPTLGRRGR